MISTELTSKFLNLYPKLELYPTSTVWNWLSPYHLATTYVFTKPVVGDDFHNILISIDNANILISRSGA